jgi:hypothetical protein
MPHHFPEIQGGGSLILAWQIRNKKFLLLAVEKSVTAIALV